METEELQQARVHHGRNIRRTRIEKGIKQEAMADLVHLSQPAISKYESMKVIDDEMLARFARALKVPVDYLRTLEEEAPSVVFENVTNTVNNSDNGGSGTTIDAAWTGNNNDSKTNNFNPIEKIVELYDQLLKEKDEKYAMLEKRIQKLEQRTD